MSGGLADEAKGPSSTVFRMGDSRMIRWGICGTGRIANEFAKALVLVDDAQLVAVASHDSDRCEAFGIEHGVERRHVGYEVLAADGDVDVVYVASTQNRHVDDALLFLLAGKHVLCEKPFALNLGDAQRMVSASADANRFLMEALWSRFLPSYVKLNELLCDGAIGEVLHIEANFGFRVPDESIDGHRLFDPAKGGGALFDLGIYPVNLAHFVLGSPSSVVANGRLMANGLDEHSNLQLAFEGGATAQLHAAVRTPCTNRARIAGTEGAIDVAPFMHAANQFTLRQGDENEVFDFPRASLHFQVPEVHRCIRSGLLESPMMSHEDTLAMMTTLDLAATQIGIRFT